MGAINLEEMARQAKEAHSANNLPGTKDSENDPPLEETSKLDFNNDNDEDTISITDGEGIASKMNQMIAEENDDLDFEVEEPESVVDPDEKDDDDESVMIIPDAPDISESDSLLVSDEFTLENEEIMAAMENIPEEDAEPLCEPIRRKVVDRRRDLIVIRKMDPDAATSKARAFMKELAEEENIRYLKDHPELLVLTVNKENEKDLKFTDEEKAKMVKSKVIKLEVVETDTLEVQKVRRVDKRHKLAVIQSMDRYMSQYSVPLPVMNDFVTFKGAQLIEINNLRVDESTTLLEVTEKKANLVYRQLLSGANISKFDEKGKANLSYGDFLNKFPINDLDLAVYGVMVASSMEEMETDLPCDDCGQATKAKYNLKTLMRTTGLSETFKDRFEEILENKSNAAHLQKMYDENNKTYKMKSPITKNIYEINTPTIARAIGLYEVIDPDNEVDTYLSVIYQYIDKIWMHDSDLDDYVIVEGNEYQELFAAVRTLPQTELNLLGQFVEPLSYRPYFSIKYKCEHCGSVMEKALSMNDLIFLATQGSPTEIRL